MLEAKFKCFEGKLPQYSVSYNDVIALNDIVVKRIAAKVDVSMDSLQAALKSHGEVQQPAGCSAEGLLRLDASIGKTTEVTVSLSKQLCQIRQATTDLKEKQAGDTPSCVNVEATSGQLAMPQPAGIQMHTTVADLEPGMHNAPTGPALEKDRLDGLAEAFPQELLVQHGLDQYDSSQLQALVDAAMEIHMRLEQEFPHSNTLRNQ